MIVMPSIDISKGKAVKRIRGEKNSGIEIADALKVAEEIYELGYEHLHVVDLDAAEGSGENEDKIRQVANLGFKWIQVGGGIRSLEKALRISRIASAIVISTLPFVNFKEFEKINSVIGYEKILLSLDYDENYYIRVKGWKEKINIKLQDFLNNIKFDIKGIIFTYIPNEGSMSGIDRGIKDYARKLPFKIKEYAGGIFSFDDLLELKNAGFNYAIVGMSFYRGHLKGVKYV
ncbi:MAG: 1-(5-phosphoribosyl)-5-((5-phosphoribosylamino)methylideneamino)imidazole-4-carboxamide isomerase [Sulfolobaceae archaeon]